MLKNNETYLLVAVPLGLMVGPIYVGHHRHTKDLLSQIHTKDLATMEPSMYQSSATIKAKLVEPSQGY